MTWTAPAKSKRAARSSGSNSACVKKSRSTDTLWPNRSASEVPPPRANHVGKFIPECTTKMSRSGPGRLHACFLSSRVGVHLQVEQEGTRRLARDRPEARSYDGRPVCRGMDVAARTRPAGGAVVRRTSRLSGNGRGGSHGPGKPRTRATEECCRDDFFVMHPSSLPPPSAPSRQPFPLSMETRKADAMAAPAAKLAMAARRLAQGFA